MLSKITPKFLAVSEQQMFDPPTEIVKSCNEATVEKGEQIIYFKRFVIIHVCKSEIHLLMLSIANCGSFNLKDIYILVSSAYM